METLILSLVGLAVPAHFAAAYRHPEQYRKYVFPLAIMLLILSLCCFTAFGFAIDIALEQTRSPDIAPLISSYGMDQLRFAIESYQPRKRWLAVHFMWLIYLFLLLFLPELGLTWKQPIADKADSKSA
jgi:hypothetical protein